MSAKSDFPTEPTAEHRKDHNPTLHRLNDQTKLEAVVRPQVVSKGSAASCASSKCNRNSVKAVIGHGNSGGGRFRN